MSQNNTPNGRRLFTAAWFRYMINSTVAPMYRPELVENIILVALAIFLAAACYQQLGKLKVADPVAEAAEVQDTVDTSAPLSRIIATTTQLPNDTVATQEEEIRPVPPASRKWQTNLQPKKERTRMRIVFAIAAIALLCTIFTLVERSRKLKDPNVLRDPGVLTGLFTEYKKWVLDLPTPRKIKRFSNKVRIQYEHFKALGLLHTPQHTEWLFVILLSLEYNPQLLKAEFGEFHKALGESIRIIAQPPLADMYDYDLLREIHEFNRGVFV